MYLIVYPFLITSRIIRYWVQNSIACAQALKTRSEVVQQFPTRKMKAEAKAYRSSPDPAVKEQLVTETAGLASGRFCEFQFKTKVLPDTTRKQTRAIRCTTQN